MAATASPSAVGSPMPSSSSPPPPPSGPRPDASELWSLAETLGIELPQEKHLLHVVRAAMKAPLPPHWSAHQTPQGENYYFNARSGQSRWMRPVTPANHEALRLARLSGAATSPPTAEHSRAASGSGTQQTSPLLPTATSQTPRPAPSSSASARSAARATMPAPAAGATSGGLLGLANVASLAMAAAAKSKSQGTSRKGSHDFSVEAQAQLLSSFGGADLKGIALVQRWFRRWRLKRQLLIRSKMRSSRMTMDADMASRLALGKRRTMDMSGSPSTSRSGAATPRAGLLATRTTPATPTTRSGRQSPTHSQSGAYSLQVSSAGGSALSNSAPSAPSSASSGSTLSVDAELLSAKKRASMQRMLAIQSRFRADGTLEIAPATPSSQSQSPQERDAVAATRAAAAAAAASSSGDELGDRRGARLNNRRRTFTREETADAGSAANTAAAASSSSYATPSRSSAVAVGSTSSRPLNLPPSGTEQNLRFLFLVVRLQRRFKAHRALLRAKLEEKVKALQRRQTMDADRKLRRASMPMGQLLQGARNRISLGAAESGLAATAQHIVAHK